MSRDYPALAESLVADFDDRPAERALRISGLYAAIWMEDPFLFRWAGLACWVSVQVHRALAGPNLGLGASLAYANRRIWASIAPDLLCFRDGGEPDGALGPGFRALRHAESLLVTDPLGAEREARAALLLHADIEQRRVVQPVYATMSETERRTLAPIFAFRLGLDTAAPILRFPGEDPTDVEARMAWVRQDILPAWNHATATRHEALRSDADRLRRRAGVRIETLPARLR